MIAVIICAIALIFFKISPTTKNKLEPSIKIEPTFKNEPDIKLDKNVRERIKQIEEQLVDSELTGNKLVLDVSDLPKNWAELMQLNALLSDANVTVVQNGKHLPTIKQVIEMIANEPRPSP